MMDTNKPIGGEMRMISNCGGDKFCRRSIDEQLSYGENNVVQEA